MKCDNLQRYEVRADYDAGTIDVPCDNDKYGKYFLVDDVMEAIAELKEKLMPCLNGDCILTCEVVEKYGKENAELKQKLEDAGMENRKLKRALWIARAERAKDRATTCNDFAYLGDTEREINMTLARTWMKCRMLKPSEWSKVWNNVERKCRAKAEEYK